MWVNFRQSAPDPLEKLIWGLCGIRRDGSKSVVSRTSSPIVSVENPSSPTDLDRAQYFPTDQSAYQEKGDSPYIFISYSQEDRAYVDKLVEGLSKQQLKVWIEKKQIGYGDNLHHVIEEALDNCQVFIVVMTPNSRKAKWVMNELSRATRLDKFIVGILLKGKEPWLGVESTLWVDVRNGKPLPDEFYTHIRRKLTGQ